MGRRHQCCGTLLLIVLLPGCTSTYRALPSENEDPSLLALKQATTAMQRESRRLEVMSPSGRPYRLAVHDYGDPNASRCLVFVHGILSDSRMWRFLAGPLAADHRVIAVDLIGCGDSDKPSPREMGEEAFAPNAQADAILQALEQQLAGYEGSITLVGHSLGGMICLRMRSDPVLREKYSQLQERIAGLVLFTPAHVAIERRPEVFDAIVRSNDLVFALASATPLLREKVAEATLTGVVDPAMALREEADRGAQILSDPRCRRAAVALLQAAVPRRDADRPDWKSIRDLEKQYRQVDLPCLILWGDRDETLPRSMAHLLVDEIPTARLRVVRDAMHSIPTEKPELALQVLRQFDAEKLADLSAFSVLDASALGLEEASEVSQAASQ